MLNKWLDNVVAGKLLKENNFQPEILHTKFILRY